MSLRRVTGTIFAAGAADDPVATLPGSALCACCEHNANLEPGRGPKGETFPCAWCGDPSTHVHMHKVVGGACAHFACPKHSTVNDGNHVVHRIAWGQSLSKGGST